MSFRVSNRNEEQIAGTAKEAAKLWHLGFLSGSTPRVIELESGTEYVMNFGDLVPASSPVDEKDANSDGKLVMAASA